MNTCILQIHAQGQWHDVTSVSLQREALAQGLAAMAPKLAQIAQQGTALRLETEVHLHL